MKNDWTTKKSIIEENSKLKDVFDLYKSYLNYSGENVNRLKLKVQMQFENLTQEEKKDFTELLIKDDFFTDHSKLVIRETRGHLWKII